MLKVDGNEFGAPAKRVIGRGQQRLVSKADELVASRRNHPAPHVIGNRRSLSAAATLLAPNTGHDGPYRFMTGWAFIAC